MLKTLSSKQLLHAIFPSDVRDEFMASVSVILACKTSQHHAGKHGLALLVPLAVGKRDEEIRLFTLPRYRKICFRDAKVHCSKGLMLFGFLAKTGSFHMPRKEK